MTAAIWSRLRCTTGQKNNPRRRPLSRPAGTERRSWALLGPHSESSLRNAHQRVTLNYEFTLQLFFFDALSLRSPIPSPDQSGDILRSKTLRLPPPRQPRDEPRFAEPLHHLIQMHVIPRFDDDFEQGALGRHGAAGELRGANESLTAFDLEGRPSPTLVQEKRRKILPRRGTHRWRGSPPQSKLHTADCRRKSP
jgi:hypothetical protein